MSESEPALRRARQGAARAPAGTNLGNRRNWALAMLVAVIYAEQKSLRCGSKAFGSVSSIGGLQILIGKGGHARTPHLDLSSEFSGDVLFHRVVSVLRQVEVGISEQKAPPSQRNL